MKNKLLRILVALSVPLFVSGASFAASVDLDPYKQFIDYCQRIGNDRKVCDCAFTKAKYSGLTLKQIEETSEQLRARRPAEPIYVQKLNDSISECVAQVNSQEADRAAMTENLDVPPPPPPPPPPSIQPLTDENKPADGQSIDNFESDFLSQIKNKGKPITEPPITPDSEKEKTEEAPKKKPKKDTEEKPVKKQYFGQYNDQYFEAAASGNLKALYAITPLLDKPDVRNEKGDTPLMVAAQYGQISAVKYLLSKKANVNAQNYQKQTALHIASFSRRPDIVELLLKNKADVNASYNGGYTPIMLAVMAQDVDTIKILAANGAADSKLDNGDGLMHLAASTNNQDMISYMIKLGVEVDAPNKNGETPLMHAAKQNKTYAVLKLLESGANLNAVDVGGRNAYAIAYAAGARDAVNVILTYAQKRGGLGF